MKYPYKVQSNDPNKKGEYAGKGFLFGKNYRYAVYPVHTMFHAVTWFVADAERTDERGFSSIVRQADSYEDAIKGLEL